MSPPNAEQRFIGLVTAEGPDAVEKMQRLRAVAQELGGVTIQAAAYEEQYADLQPAERQRQNRLDARLTKVIHDLTRPKSTHNLFGKLDRAGIRFVRDALVIGKSGMDRLTRLTALQRDCIEASLAAHCPDEVYLDTPSPNDVAKLCLRLDQVHAGAIPRFWSRALEGSDDAQQNRVTLDQLIAQDFQLPEGFRLWDSDYNHAPVRLDAFQFAAEFLAARAESQS